MLSVVTGHEHALPSNVQGAILPGKTSRFKVSMVVCAHGFARRRSAGLHGKPDGRRIEWEQRERRVAGGCARAIAEGPPGMPEGANAWGRGSWGQKRWHKPALFDVR